MRNSSLLIMEIIWIATGAVCLGTGIRLVITTSGNKALIFILLSLVCFLFAWLRHNQRKKS